MNKVFSKNSWQEETAEVNCEKPFFSWCLMSDLCNQTMPCMSCMPLKIHTHTHRFISSSPGFSSLTISGSELWADGLGWLMQQSLAAHKTWQLSQSLQNQGWLGRHAASPLSAVAEYNRIRRKCNSSDHRTCLIPTSFEGLFKTTLLLDWQSLSCVMHL